MPMLTEEASRTIRAATGIPLASGYSAVNHTGASDEPIFVPVLGKQSLAVSEASASMQRDILQHACRLFFDRAHGDACATLGTGNLFPAVLDAAYLEETSQREKKFEFELWTFFEAEPLEDGLNHPAEKTIREVLQSRDRPWALRWLKTLVLDTSRPAFAASVLRCLGRQKRPGTVSWRVEIVRAALAKDDIEIRDAAAQAAEAWSGSDMRRVLQDHFEPEPWLRSYIEDIVEDLAK